VLLLRITDRLPRTAGAQVLILTLALIGCALPARAAQSAAADSAAARSPVARSAGADSSRLTIRPYTIRSLDGSERPAEFGRLVVPELHSRPGGRMIAIVFLRLRSTSPTPGSPVIFLPGGPGYPGTLLARAPTYLRFFERLREQSDVIVLDQRGSGLSEPTLQCTTKNPLPPDAFETEAKTASALGGMVRPCVRLVRGDNIAVEAFNTVESAEDLEDLRRAIGAERVRLIGVSYGTELALEMIRRHGDRVEAAVLAGTRGPDMVWRLPETIDIQLRRFSAVVAADPRWGPLLPDFEGTVRRVIETLTWKPAAVMIHEAKTGTRTRVRVGAVGIQALLGSDMSDWTRAPFLPALFGSLARGDSTLFARRVEDLVNNTSGGISIMGIATDCASGASPERRSLVARQTKTALLGNVKNMLVNPAFCDLIGSGDLGPAFREPITSNVRTLFLTGSLDGITPPFQAEEVRWGFPLGVHLIVENGYHEVLAFADPQQAAVDFFAGQDVRTRRITLSNPKFLSIESAQEMTAPGPRK
jgi:pimeloyl-ACP methyl ester carboxylesterase